MLPEELYQRTVQRRAVEAAIRGMPLVSVDAMRQAYFRDAGAKYNDIVYFSKPADWRFQFTTPNASTHHVYFNFNLKDGPVVLDVPPAVGAGLFGSLVDAWQKGNDVIAEGRPADGSRLEGGMKRLHEIAGDLRFEDIAGRPQILSGSNEVYAFVNREKDDSGRAT